MPSDPLKNDSSVDMALVKSLHKRNMWDPDVGRTEKRTEAGFGIKYKHPFLLSAGSNLSGFIRKNKGLLTDRDFWNLFLRILRSRNKERLHRGDKRIRFVITHHKAMTTYFTAVLKPLSFATRARYEVQLHSPPRPNTTLFLSAHGKVDFEYLRPYRAVHVMRDPRDMIVSGYHYHKWTHEAWAHRVDKEGWSYQQKLNHVDKSTGLFMEIDHFVFMYRDLLEKWNMNDPDMLEISFEELLGDDREHTYRLIFAFLEYEGDDLDIAVELMRLFEAKRRTGSELTNVNGKHQHIRSGRSEQWREELNQKHLAYIEAQLGSVLRKFGYQPH